MDEQLARRLARMTGDFYAQVAPSFSATRQEPWPGWERVAVLLPARCAGPALRVLDLACGNLRFERFLAGRLGRGRGIETFAYDACDELSAGQAPPGISVRYVHLDVAEELLAGGDLAERMGGCAADLAVCFGFLHHLALPEHRRQVLAALVDACVPGGVVAVSFWQLSRSERLLGKACATTERVRGELGLEGLGRGDYLLGWQGRTDVLRYCHDFAEEEIDELAQAVAPRAREMTRFSDDGGLNRYLVLQVRG